MVMLRARGCCARSRRLAHETRLMHSGTRGGSAASASRIASTDFRTCSSYFCRCAIWCALCKFIARCARVRRSVSVGVWMSTGDGRRTARSAREEDARTGARAWIASRSAAWSAVDMSFSFHCKQCLHCEKPSFARPALPRPHEARRGDDPRTPNSRLLRVRGHGSLPGGGGVVVVVDGEAIASSLLCGPRSLRALGGAQCELAATHASHEGLGVLEHVRLIYVHACSRADCSQ